MNKDNPRGYMKVLVFKTNVQTERDRESVGILLDQAKEVARWSVDLDDCDHVLRIETAGLDKQDIIGLVNESGYNCEELL